MYTYIPKLNLVPIKKIYLDLDGVLVSLEKALSDVCDVPNLNDILSLHDIVGQRDSLFFSLLPTAIENKVFEVAEPLPLYFILTTKLAKYGNKSLLEVWQDKDISVEILSSITSGMTEYHSIIATQKLRWLQKHNLDHLPIHLVKGAKEKQKYAEKGSLLIDDYLRNCIQFRQNGGYSIHHNGDVNKVMNNLSLLELFEYTPL